MKTKKKKFFLFNKIFFITFIQCKQRKYVTGQGFYCICSSMALLTSFIYEYKKLKYFKAQKKKKWVETGRELHLHFIS